MNECDIREAIDACRPGRDDLELPEMAELRERMAGDDAVRRRFERTQRRDAAMTAAFADVAVPPGLEARLSAAVQDATAESAELAVAQGDVVSLPARAGETVRFWRRRSVLAIAGLAAALLVAALGWQLLYAPPFQGSVVDEVVAWSEALPEAAWNEGMAVPGDTHPLDGDVRGTPWRWTRLRTQFDSKAVVYDLAHPGQPAAWVFCVRIRGRLPNVPTSAPSQPVAASGGLSVGVWQRDGLLYALAVEGGERRYRRYVGAEILIGLLDAPAIQSSPRGKV